MSRVIEAFHGTSTAAARNIVINGVTASSNPYDWLGYGAYFFEYDADRSAHWATQVHGGDGCVLRASIELADCLDLTTMAGRSVLQPYYETLLAGYAADGYSSVDHLRQSSGAHRLDCKVIDLACSYLAKQGRPVSVVRGLFPEGNPLHRDATGLIGDSSFLDLSHIQVAVRDPNVVREVELWHRPRLRTSS